MATLRSLSSKNVKPTKIAGDSELLRGAFVELNAGRKFLWVTDGAGMIVRYPIHDSTDIEEGYVPREALLHIEAGAKFKGNQDEIRIGTTYSHVNPRTKKVREGKPRARYSREEPVWKPNEHDRRDYPVMCEVWPKRPVAASIIVDTVKLRAMAMALGTPTLQIEVDVEGDGDSSPLLIADKNGIIVGALEQGRLA